MFSNPSLIARITYGKLIGFVFAGTGIIIIPYIFPDLAWQMKLAFLLYYISLGAFIGLMGVLTYHPVIKMPLPWCVRGPATGAWMNFVLMLFIYDKMSLMLAQAFGQSSFLISPWWFVLEGAIFGFLVDFICTRYAGEGVKCVSDAEHNSSVE